MKTIIYPQLPGLVIADAVGGARSLSQDVWRHEKLARARAMPLVLEIHARSVLASRRLTEWWQSGDQLMQDTLQGIYLLRVDLQRFGPEAVLRLTPYAATGAPVFIGWNEVGQVCSRTQFLELTREAFALPLSAFFEDVLKGRQHSLNPVPTLGNAERTREALLFKRASQALLAARRSQTGSKGAVEAASVEAASVEAASVEAASVEAASTVPQIPEGEPVSEEPAVAEDMVSSEADSDAPSPVQTGDERPEVDRLDLLLERARGAYAVLEDRVGVKLRLTLDDLRAIDGYLLDKDDDERRAFARELGVVLAVYVGDTIRQRVQADWWLSTPSVSLSGVELRATVQGEDKSVQPMEWVIEILSDPTRSLYGQALGWCRIY